MSKVVKVLKIIGLVLIGIVIGWFLNIFTQSKIPYSYRTDNLILDILAAVGVRDYNP